MKKLLCATFLGATISPFAIAPAAMAQDAAGMPEETGNLVTATATLEGDGIKGTVTLTEASSGIVIIEIEASGLEPGPHGVHLHETGTCDAEGGHRATASMVC
jgi:superoxide dismutase, Cu-Zn family